MLGTNSRYLLLAVAVAAVALMGQRVVHPAVAEPPATETDVEVIVQGRAYGASTGCSWAELAFSGRLFSQSPGSSKQPLQRATYTADNGWDEPSEGEIATADAGVFRIGLPVWNHSYSTRREGHYHRVEGKARVTIVVAGCKPRSFVVDRHWKPRDIVLRCSERTDQD